MSLVEGGIARLQSAAGLGFGGGAPRELFSLWRVGALLLLAAVATYGSLIARVRLILRLLRNRLRKSVALAQPLQDHCYCSSDDDACSSCSNEEEDELLSDAEAEERAEDDGEMDNLRRVLFSDYLEDVKQDGGYNLRGGREVVKAWGDADLCFLDSPSALGGVVALLDPCRGEVVRSFTAGVPPVFAGCAASTFTPSTVVYAADAFFGRRLELHVWDARVAGTTPAAAFADMTPRLGRRVRRLGGDGKVVYVGDGTGSAAAVDLRTVRSSVAPVAEEDATWWDADAVLVGGNDVAGFPRDGTAEATHHSRPRRK